MRTIMSNKQEYTNHAQYSSSQAEINLDQFKDNLKAIAGICSAHVKLMAVVKANAYGHGAERIARTALKAGADCLAVANISEGIYLRSTGVQSMILILGVLVHKWIPAIFDNKLTPSIATLEDAILINEYGKSIHHACKVHFRVESGNGNGEAKDDLIVKLIRDINQMEYLQLEGLYTHLPSAYADDLTLAKNDIRIFDELVNQLQQQGIFIPLIHAASSPAILNLPEAHYNMVRCGILMYGLPATSNQPHIAVKPIMKIRSEIVAYKQIEPGHTYGYANKFVTDKLIHTAVIPFGYGDGNFMFYLQQGEVLIRGRHIAIIGQIYMDHFLVDVSNIHTELGDEVIILGEQGSQEIAAVDIAEQASIGRLNSDFICLLSGRVPRIYIEENLE